MSPSFPAGVRYASISRVPVSGANEAFIHGRVDWAAAGPAAAQRQDAHARRGRSR